MTDEKKSLGVDAMRSKLRTTQSRYENSPSDEVFDFKHGDFITEASESSSWRAVSQITGQDSAQSILPNNIDFVGKNLANGKYAGENFQNANFSVSNLTGVDFSGADLRGVDFSGANLTDANLNGADLSGAVLSGSVLARTNFTGAKLNGVKLTEADLEDAIMLDIQIDDLGIEELQDLIEYMAKYYPHKLNLTRLNLTLLNLKKIDLTKINLRGVDFTGVDFTGINIMELDLSECIITPQQIAQALGRVPGAEEMKRILAPKKKKGPGYNGIDMSELFLGNGKEFGVWDTLNDKGISIETLMKVGKKVFRHGAEKPAVKNAEALKDVKSMQEQEVKSHNDKLREVIEERKKKELEARAAMKVEFQKEVVKDLTPPEVVKDKDPKEIAEKIVKMRDHGRE